MEVVIYWTFCSDVAQGRKNGPPMRLELNGKEINNRDNDLNKESSHKLKQSGRKTI